MELPEDYGALIAALSQCVISTKAGMLMPDQHEDTDYLEAALDEACVQAGVEVRYAWLGDRDSLAWLRADDSRLADPNVQILGVRIGGTATAFAPGSFTPMGASNVIDE